MAQRPNLACCLFLYGPQTKNGYYIFLMVEKKSTIIFHDMWKLCKFQISVSINKATLVHLRTAYGCFHTTVAQLSSYNRNYIAHKA